MISRIAAIPSFGSPKSNKPNKTVLLNARPANTRPVSLAFAATRPQRDEAFFKYNGVTPDVRMFYPKSTDRSPTSPAWIQEMVVWDSDVNQFIFRRESFDQRDVFDRGKQIQDRVGLSAVEIAMPDKTLVRDGVYVDQTHGRLYLPNGSWIDGPTGEFYTTQGVAVSSLAQQQRFEKEV